MAQKYFEQAMRDAKRRRDGGKPKPTKRTPYWTRCLDGKAGDIKNPDTGKRVACPWNPGK